MRYLLPCLLSSTLAYAAPDLSTLKTRLTTLENQVKAAEHYNPTASSAHGLLLGGDMLYWQAQENGMPYAIQVMNPLNFLNDPQQRFKSHFKQMQYDWDFGARTHVGWAFKRDSWRLLCTWTHFNTKATDRGFNNNPSKRFDPIWANPAFTVLIDTAIQAKASWHLFHNTIDLTLGRPFHVSRYLVLQPEAGVSAASIKQHLRLNYTRALIPGTSKPILSTDFVGAGLLAGLDTRFILGGGISLFNLTHVELYAGHFHTHRTEKFLTNLNPTWQEQEIKDSFRKICPAFQMQIGFRWDKALFKGKQSFAVKLAYDYQLFFSQNQFFRLIDPTPSQIISNQGDLSLSGGTFSLLLTL